MSTATEPVSSRPDATPADVLRQLAVHTVTGPSTGVYKIRIPGIATMLSRGFLPDHLIGLALLDLESPKGAASALRELLDLATDEAKHAKIVEEISKFGEYQRRIVAASLVEPALTYEEVAAGDLPEDDLAMIANIVQRLTNVDARGVTIGVEPLDHWARFHDLHGLPPDGGCDGCRRIVAESSSIDVGAM